MKKITFLALLCAFIFPSLLLAQEKEKSIRIKTEIAFGESFSFVVNPAEGVSSIKVDWGNGTQESYNIRHNDMTFFRKVSGSIKGESITIYGDIEELDASGLKITAFETKGENNLKILNLSDNGLTRENLVLTGLSHLENLNLSKNKLSLLNVQELKSLIYLSASNNPSLGGVLLPKESKSLKQITLDHCDISNFSPIPLPALTLLNLSNNALMKLDLGDNYPLLTELSLGSNFISNINLSGVPKLANLDLSKNQIETLNLSPLKELVTLYLQENKLKTLDLTQNSNLTRIDISKNQIKTLNTLQQNRLIDLNCSNNQIDILDLSKNTFLKTFRAAYNKLSFLNFSTNTMLGYIDLRYNPEMTPCSVNFMFRTMWDCKGRSYSANLLLEGSNAEKATADVVTGSDYKWKTDITFSSTPDDCKDLSFTLTNDPNKGEVVLKSYDTGTNTYHEIKEKAPAGTPILVEVTPKKDFLFGGIKSNGALLSTNPFILKKEGTTLEVIWKEQNEITLGTSIDHPLSFALTPTESGIVAIDWGNGDKVNYNLEEGKSKRIDHPALGDHITIYGDLLSADFSSYPGMGTWDNAFSSIQLKGMKSLEELSIYMNPIKALDITSLSMLKVLDCAFTQLESLTVESNKALTKLVCYGNKLKVLNLKENKELTELSCRNNRLTSLDLSQNSKLTLLDAQNNLLETIELEQLTLLEIVRLTGNKLAKLDLSQNSLIKDLVLSRNKISTLSINHLPNLRLLYIDGNNIKAIDLSKNTKLIYLNCANNGMTACQLNDLFATLPKYPSKVDIKLPDNVNLRISDNNQKNPNKAEKSETILATIQGWKPNVVGDATGCDEAYLFIESSDYGTFSLSDDKGKEIPSGGKAQKGTIVKIQPKANKGYGVETIKINGKTSAQPQFKVERSTWVQILFKKGIETIDKSDLFFLQGNILHTSSAVKAITLYNKQGEAIFTTNRGEEETILPSFLSEDHYILLLQTNQGGIAYKIYLHK